jgi:hypothetical protein
MPKPSELFMLMLGCKPAGRHTEQHDVFFTIGKQFNELKADIYSFWSDGGRIHVDAWRIVRYVDGHRIRVVPRNASKSSKLKLFFLNLGGYQPGNMDELHYKLLLVARTKAEAIRRAKTTSFFQEMDFKGAHSHIDDQFGVDVDDIYQVEDILPHHLKKNYALEITPEAGEEDALHIGYTKLPIKSSTS